MTKMIKQKKDEQARYVVPLGGKVWIEGEAGGIVMIRATEDGIEVFRTRAVPGEALHPLVHYLTSEP